MGEGRTFLRVPSPSPRISISVNACRWVSTASRRDPSARGMAASCDIVRVCCEARWKHGPPSSQASTCVRLAAARSLAELPSDPAPASPPELRHGATGPAEVREPALDRPGERRLSRGVDFPMAVPCRFGEARSVERASISTGALVRRVGHDLWSAPLTPLIRTVGAASNESCGVLGSSGRGAPPVGLRGGPVLGASTPIELSPGTSSRPRSSDPRVLPEDQGKCAQRAGPPVRLGSFAVLQHPSRRRTTDGARRPAGRADDAGSARGAVAYAGLRACRLSLPVWPYVPTGAASLSEVS